MSVDDLLQEESVEERKKRLQKAAEDAVEEQTEKQRKAIEALASVSEAETEVVDLMGVDYEVLVSPPGRVSKKAARVSEVSQMEGVSLLCEVLAEITVDDEYDTDFWLTVFENVPMGRFMDVVEALTEPAQLHMKQRAERSDAMDGFRTK